MDSPSFGLTLLVMLCLSELLNAIVKLYCVRARPLWMSSTLRRKGSAWENDSSFPSSHSQTVSTILTVLLLEGKNTLPFSTWQVLLYMMGSLTLLSGFSRAYLAMHYISDVVSGWLLGFLVTFFVHQMSLVSTLARLPLIHSLGISVFSTIYILGVVILSSHSGQASTKPESVKKWLKTAQSNQTHRVQDNKKSTETLQPHDAAKYMLQLGCYFGTTAGASILSHVFLPFTTATNTTITATSGMPLHSYYSQAPPLVRLLIGIGGLVLLDTLKSAMFKREKRQQWPEWAQGIFTFCFYSLAGAWVVLGAELVFMWGWPLPTAVL